MDESDTCEMDKRKDKKKNSEVPGLGTILVVGWALPIIILAAGVAAWLIGTTHIAEMLFIMGSVFFVAVPLIIVVSLAFAR